MSLDTKEKQNGLVNPRRSGCDRLQPFPMWLFFTTGGAHTYMVEFRGDEPSSEVRSTLEKSLGVTVSPDVPLPDLSTKHDGDRIDITTGFAPIIPSAPLSSPTVSTANIQAIVKLGFDEDTARTALQDSHDDQKAALRALMMRTRPTATAPGDRLAIRDLRKRFPQISVPVIQEVYQACGKDSQLAATILSTR